jgi:hypothetical protein
MSCWVSLADTLVAMPLVMLVGAVAVIVLLMVVGVAAPFWGGPRAVLGAEALVGGPCLEQGPVHEEVLGRGVATKVGSGGPRGEESVGDFVLQKALPVLGERGGVERLRLDGKVQEPLEQQVVVSAARRRPARSGWSTGP